MEELADNQYRITLEVDGVLRTFQTVTKLRDIGSLKFIGRATRAWKVFDLSEPQRADGTRTYYVLKDSWVFDEYPFEHENVAACHKALQSTDDAYLLRHLPVVVCASQVGNQTTRLKIPPSSVPLHDDLVDNDIEDERQQRLAELKFKPPRQRQP